MTFLYNNIPNPLINRGGGRSSQEIQRKENNGQQDLINLASKSHCLLSPSLITVDDYYKTNGLNDINLQLHATSSEVSNPYSFNITKDIGFSAACMAENTITVTIGDATDAIIINDKTTCYFYGYNSNVNNGPVFGECSPSTYRGIKISSIYIQVAVSDTIQGPNTTIIFCISFAEHVNINSIDVEGVTYSINNNHFDDDTLGCIYIISRDDDVIDFSYLLNLFTHNVGKQITITLE